MTDLYLAYAGTAVERTLDTWNWDDHPLNLLVALPYLCTYQRAADKHTYRPANMMLDSGAFSAWRSGKEVDIDQLVELSKQPKWTHTVGLDVIGDWAGSRKNMDYMREQGSPAMPVFHIGDPWDLLAYYCENWEMVGLSCRFGEPVAESMRFYEQCFARQWPHRFHSFGWLAEKPLFSFPFYTADASTWQQGPLVWRSAMYLSGNASLPTARNCSNKVIADSLHGTILHYLDLQARLKSRWKKEMAKLNG